MVGLIVGSAVGCSTRSITREEGDALLSRLKFQGRNEQSRSAVEAFAKKDYGFASFPEITKVAWSLGEPHFENPARFKHHRHEALAAADQTPFEDKIEQQRIVTANFG